MKKAKLTISLPKIYSSDYWEELEDKLRDFFRDEGFSSGTIEDSVTGNTTQIEE